MKNHVPLRIKKIAALAAQGKSGAEIAAALGVSKGTIAGTCSRHRIKLLGKRGYNVKVRTRCVEMRGYATAAAIAAELGITKNAVIGHWHRARESGQIAGDA